jgi:NADH-quinone oxidoreductase subunit M
MDLLSFGIFSPLIGVVLLLFVQKKQVNLIKGISLTTSTIPVIVSIFLLRQFDTTISSFQFTKNLPWIPFFGINYHIGLDGMSLPLFLLTSLLTLLSIIISFNIKERLKEYFISFLILETGMLGVFSALDLFLFYIFWELVLIPMYLIIGVWGGENRVYAAIKFIIYTAAGSLFMLIGIIWLFIATHTFSIPELYSTEIAQARWIWLLLFLGFAVKVPIFPFHTWLPDAHTEAPTAGSVILAGILLKLGTYGLLRVNFSIFPKITSDLALYLAILGLINTIYGAFCAMSQKDLKRMIACSSISHMGYILLGMASLNQIGVAGAILQMVNHGMITGSLFMLVGVLYDRAHHREILGFGGIARIVPAYTALMGISALASIGLPGLSGFVSELLCFLGGFKVYPKITAGCVLGVLISAIYILYMFKEIFLGELNPKYSKLSDIDFREWVSLAPLSFFIFLFGVWPKCIIDIMDVSVQAFSQLF